MDKKTTTVKWSEEDKFAFTHTKLRAQTVPDGKKKASKQACRRWNKNDHNG
jgi:hypothetical protein